MPFAKVYSAQTNLLEPNIIDVEVDLSRGLHSISVVGLAGKAVDESKDRVSAAIKNSGFKSPKNQNQKIVISLAPADLKKEGPNFDLAIALAYLLSAKKIKFNPRHKIFLGELSLDGKLRKIPGILPLVRGAKETGFKEIYLPKKNAKEGALIEGVKIYGVDTLKEVVDHLDDTGDKKREGGLKRKINPQPKTEVHFKEPRNPIDFSDIKGQESAKRALKIAAAGRHNILMYGPPGTGKTMLAKAFCHILPPLNFEETLETTSIHSIAGKLLEKTNLISNPPFRAPHHTSSYVSLVGGGAVPKPGEVTLSHRGVLFLDEFPEFDRKVIDSLREPLEEKQINVSRAKGSAFFPANFILIAAMNPCPCGNYGVKGKECLCSPINLERYRKKLSGPIIDRIDLWTEVSRIEHGELSPNKKRNGQMTRKIRGKIEKAREVQRRRFQKLNLPIKTNSEMGVRDLIKSVSMEKDAVDILNQSAEKLDISPRSYHKTIKIAQTISDLSESEKILPEHVLEALQYRVKTTSNPV